MNTVTTKLRMYDTSQKKEFFFLKSELQWIKNLYYLITKHKLIYIIILISGSEQSQRAQLSSASIKPISDIRHLHKG